MERKPYEDRYNALKSEASTWETSWKDIQTYLCPLRGHFDSTTPNDGKKIDHKTILDGHASRALNTLSSGMTSGLTSPSRPWFKLGLSDQSINEIDAVRQWLDIVQERMMAVFSKSNIYGVLNNVYAEVGSFGTNAVIIVEDFNDIIRGRNFTCGEFFLGTGKDGRVDTFARRYQMTVKQLVDEFGLEKCSESVQNQYKLNTVDSWVSVIHLIEPNDKRIADRLDFKGKPYRSVYWEDGSPTDTFLDVRGFDDFPVLAPRWNTTTTSTIYGKGPGWEALGDIKMLMKMQKNKLIALDKMVDPPMQIGGGNDNVEVNTMPGGLSRTSAMSPDAGLKPAYEVRLNLNDLELMIEKTKISISATFFADLFMMISQIDRPNMTAREVVERHEEKLLMLGPVLERLESELLDPLIDRTFNIMQKLGLIPEPPAELQGQDLKVEYISMLAQAQKMVGITAIEQTLSFVGNIAAVKPEIIDTLDLDAAVNEYAQMMGIPPNIVRSKEVVEAIRAKRAEAQAQAQQAAAVPDMVKGAEVLSKTELGKNSALDAMLAGAAGLPPTGQ